ncbi:hypothetical protein DV495_003614 [Geotrichum candidum]|nr:hypothetical protein DV495_003614 [Geotrichum candidum]KAF7498727.1 hypothetical protein DV113_003259 [Geotrichum candidum]KAI8133743.1 hypothetical protein DUD61_002614 [Geotrichum candidum]
MSNLMRAFLQTFLLHPSMPESEVMAHLSRLALAKNPDKPASPSDLDPIIAAANTTLADLELEIVVTRDQRTGERIFTYANLHSTPSTRPATALPATDVALFRGIIDFIFTNEEKMGRNEFWITPREATNDAYPRDPQNRVVVSRVQVLEKLNTLVAYGWLVKSDGGRDSDDDGGEERFGLSNRALAELAPFIKDRIASTGAPEASRPLCAACHEIFTLGVVCTGCGIRVHTSCVARYQSIAGGGDAGLCGNCQVVPIADFAEVGF